MSFAHRSFWLFFVCITLAGCSGAALPSRLSGAQTAPVTSAARPANGASGLPANGASGMPAGDFLECNLHDTPGQVDCTIAINLNIKPDGNPHTPLGLLPGLQPPDLQSAYAMPSGRTGGTVAIVDAYDDPLAEVDLAIYRTLFGLPPCTAWSGCFRRLNEYGRAGSYPALNLQWDEEMSLDMDMVSAICPNCSILLIEANSPSMDDLGTAVDTAASFHPAAISNSYYAQEWRGELSDDKHYDHPGVAVVASSGDQPASYYPAASPYVTSVSGTRLTIGNGKRTETAWGPSGHGCSAYEPKPSWQGSTGCMMRSSVDMAAVADPQTGVAFWDTTAGGWLVAGGTSIGSPIVAAAYALSHDPRKPSYSYVHASDFFEIPPGGGYKKPTGLGSPNGVGGL